MSSMDTVVRSSDTPSMAATHYNRWRPHPSLSSIGIHAILLAYTVLAMFPILLTALNSFKKQGDIFGHPYDIPVGKMLSLIGYQTVFKRADTLLYLENSLIVTVGAVVFSLLLGAMAAFALSEYNFRGNTALGLYMALGIMIPIRLGTVSIVKLSSSLGLTGTLQGLMFIYIAQNLPLAIFILGQFFREVPLDLKDAARIDGASEYHVFLLVIPLVRQALFSVAVFTMIPIWNDLWFPLIMAPSEKTRTITLGVQMFTGQFQTNWSALLAALTLAMLPVLLIYAIFSRQLIRGLMAGAVK
jgi:raffinose/stachyose/melibiose transport system permease protein